ncbi:MAG TPA: nucleotidyltransferase domain-containing protein [Clostridia bacterium]|nr:nucleotidyltransferase domain-containing protein [Clostridia bacterium]
MEIYLDRITREIAINIKDVLGEKLQKIILYGSYSRGDYDDESDIDIMVLADINSYELGQYRKDINKIASRVGLDYDIMLSISLKNVDEFYNRRDILPYYQNIIREGTEIYVN